MDMLKLQGYCDRNNRDKVQITQILVEQYFAEMYRKI